MRRGQGSQAIGSETPRLQLQRLQSSCKENHDSAVVVLDDLFEGLEADGSSNDCALAKPDRFTGEESCEAAEAGRVGPGARCLLHQCQHCGQVSVVGDLPPIDDGLRALI